MNKKSSSEDVWEEKYWDLYIQSLNQPARGQVIIKKLGKVSNPYVVSPNKLSNCTKMNKSHNVSKQTESKMSNSVAKKETMYKVDWIDTKGNKSVNDKHVAKKREKEQRYIYRCYHCK